MGGTHENLKGQAGREETLLHPQGLRRQNKQSWRPGGQPKPARTAFPPSVAQDPREGALQRDSQWGRAAPSPPTSIAGQGHPLQTRGHKGAVGAARPRSWGSSTGDLRCHPPTGKRRTEEQPLPTGSHQWEVTRAPTWSLVTQDKPSGHSGLSSSTFPANTRSRLQEALCWWGGITPTHQEGWFLEPQDLGLRNIQILAVRE